MVRSLVSWLAGVLGIAATVAVTAGARAQDEGESSDDGVVVATDSGGGKITIRTTTPASSSGAQTEGAAGGGMRNPSGSAVLPPSEDDGLPSGEAGGSSRMHQVRQGDTLWNLSARHHGSPHKWPELWSQNPHIQNPHWIYPGDQLRLRAGSGAGPGGGGRGPRQTVSLGSTGVAGMGDPNGGAGAAGAGPGGGGGDSGGSGSSGAGGVHTRSGSVAPGTVFLRTRGYLDDPDKASWGELVGAAEDQMLLHEGSHVYLMMRPKVKLRLGQQLTVFRTVRSPSKVKGARKPPGAIVAIRGTVKIDQWNPKTRIARGRLIESLDAIERGARVGPVTRRFAVVAPRRNEKTVWARVLTSFYPHEVLGQNQVLFIDRGSKDGVRPGNRFFVVRKGDTWRRSLETTTKEARARGRIDDPRHGEVEYTPLRGKQKDFPEEVTGELRVLEAREHTSLMLVTDSSIEVELGDRVVARQGY